MDSGFSINGIPARGSIHPHNDMTNTRINMHLVLRGGEAAWWEVGGVTKKGFPDGAVVVYDPSYDHAAGNDGEATRWVLTVAFPHPDLLPWLC